MSDQRTLFQKFYTKICQLDTKKGKPIAKDLFELLCNQTVIIQKYEEIMHKSYGLSAYFSIYLHVSFGEKQIYLPGNLLLSMTYFNRAKPVLILKNNEKLRMLNHTIVGNNNIVQTDFLNDWAQNPSLFDFVIDVVNQLQGNPYDYDAEEEREKAKPAPPEPEPEPEPVINPKIEFDEHIPYESLKRGKRIGEGSFGEVYIAEWKGLKVAVKEWKQAITKQEKKYLDREVTIQRALDHPNCLRLYGMSENAKGYPVLVMELADCSLTDLTTKPYYEYCKQPVGEYQPKLNFEQKCQIIREIAEGLEYIHSLRYTHRDLKLDNILMKDGHPKIADFGLARDLDSVGMTITFAGSPLFMAPELIHGRRVTNTIDCYSFGCMVSEIFYEKNCYWDKKFSNKDIFFREIMRGTRPTILKNTPREVRCLLQDCFKSKSFRPSMSILLKRIQQWDCSEWAPDSFK